MSKELLVMGFHAVPKADGIGWKVSVSPNQDFGFLKTIIGEFDSAASMLAFLNEGLNRQPQRAAGDELERLKRQIDKEVLI